MTVLARLKQWMAREGAQDGGGAVGDASDDDGGPDVGGHGDVGGDRRKPELRILVVCMGNICRSPIAEGVLRAKLAAAGLQHRVRVDSAGTHGYHTNEPPDPRAIRRAGQRGYAIGGLRARPVAPADFEDFDWMLAMDNSNLAWLKKRQPEGNSVRVDRLLEHGSQHRGLTEVPDPYYGPEAGFDQVLDLVEAACDGVVAQVKADAWRKA